MTEHPPLALNHNEWSEASPQDHAVNNLNPEGLTRADCTDKRVVSIGSPNQK